MPQLKEVCSDHLFSPTKEVPYFSYPDSTTRLKAQHIARCNFEVVEEHIIGSNRDKARVKWSGNTAELLREDDVVVKVFCYAIYSHAKEQQLSEFLKTLSALLKDLKISQRNLEKSSYKLQIAQQGNIISQLRAQLSKESPPSKKPKLSKEIPI